MSELAGEREGARRTGWKVAGAALAAVLAKGKALLGLLKFAGLGKLLLTMTSMAAMIAFEARQAGLLFAAGFVLCILVHEVGHAVAIRRAGLRSGWPVFVPFLGAFITLRDQPQDAVTEARIGIAGPWAGAGAALLCVVLYWATGQRVWLAVASSAFLLNLFNLAPIRPLDGGRVAQLLSRRAWIVGAAVLAGLLLWAPSPVLILLAIVAIPRAFRDPGPPPDAPPEARLSMAAEYLGLCAFLAAGFYFAHRLLGAA